MDCRDQPGNDGCGGHPPPPRRRHPACPDGPRDREADTILEDKDPPPMTDHSTDHSAALADFDAAISVARGADAAFKALQDLARATVGAKLFTVMLVDMPNDVARRAYT